MIETEGGCSSSPTPRSQRKRFAWEFNACRLEDFRLVERRDEDKQPAQREKGSTGKDECSPRVVDVLAQKCEEGFHDAISSFSSHSPSVSFSSRTSEPVEPVVQAEQVFGADRNIFDRRRSQPAEQGADRAAMLEEAGLARALPHRQLKFRRERGGNRAREPDQEHPQAPPRRHVLDVHKTTPPEYRQPVGDRLDLRKNMTGEDHRLPLASRLLDQVNKAGRGVQRGRGLVEIKISTG